MPRLSNLPPGVTDEMIEEQMAEYFFCESCGKEISCTEEISCESYEFPLCTTCWKDDGGLCDPCQGGED